MSTSAKVPAGHFKILYFASAGSYTAKDSEHLPAPLPIAKLFETLEERYNGMKSKVLESCLVTVNLEYVDIPEVEITGLPVAADESVEENSKITEVERKPAELIKKKEENLVSKKTRALDSTEGIFLYSGKTYSLKEIF